jgi:hypothetical protein
MARATTILFSGYQWNVRDFPGGPGPNNWSSQNVFVDSGGDLHLQINERNKQWSCAEVSLTQSLGFGSYQFQLIGRTDQLDTNVVLGLFSYGGPDGTNEIDIEDGRFGHPAANSGNYTVYPAQFVPNYVNTTNSFPISLNGTDTTQRFIWTGNHVTFQSLYGHYNDDTNDFASWTFQPNNPTVSIPQNAAPVHMNLWLAGGQPPTNGMPVEIVVSSFTFTPVPEPSGMVLLGFSLLGMISYSASRRVVNRAQTDKDSLACVRRPSTNL